MGGNCRWQTYKTGRINDLRVAPLQSTNLALSYTIPSDDKEYFLNVYYKTKKKDGLINADWEIAKDQILIKSSQSDSKTISASSSGALQLKIIQIILLYPEMVFQFNLIVKMD